MASGENGVAWRNIGMVSVKRRKWRRENGEWRQRWRSIMAKSKWRRRRQAGVINGVMKSKGIEENNENKSYQNISVKNKRNENEIEHQRNVVKKIKSGERKAMASAAWRKRHQRNRRRTESDDIEMAA
jgi:hypothetical protein